MANLIKLPGLIDIHVHLRDPGQTHKEDFLTGTTAALAGGVTAVFDMPNNLDPIFTLEKLEEKENIVSKKAVCDYALYFGTDGKNLPEFEKVKNKVIGLKVYLNLTTGKLLVENDKLVEGIFEAWPKDKVVVVHAENEKVDLVLQLSKKYGNKLHVTHVATKEMLNKIIAAKKNNNLLSCDVTPHHLFLTLKDKEILGSFSEVKPPLASQDDAKFLWENLKYIDSIATDHAPHTAEEKKGLNPASGMPGLETMLPLLITAYKESKISLDEIVRLTNTNPQKLFGLKPYSDTYVEVDLDAKYIIKNEELKTKSGWSPFNGRKVYGKVKSVYIRGIKVLEDGHILVNAGFGKNILYT